ncbi:hypothetical protein BGX27_005549 [Mortierella sp. AM989]|nr:hypothetical protein BGX27_005549 [Mortierella sp. AM989]
MANDNYQEAQTTQRRPITRHALADNIPEGALARLSQCPKMLRLWTLMYWVNRLPPYGAECLAACNNGKHVSRRHVQDDCVLWENFATSTWHTVPTNDWIDKCLLSAKRLTPKTISFGLLLHPSGRSVAAA